MYKNVKFMYLRYFVIEKQPRIRISMYFLNDTSTVQIFGIRASLINALVRGGEAIVRDRP